MDPAGVKQTTVLGLSFKRQVDDQRKEVEPLLQSAPRQCVPKQISTSSSARQRATRELSSSLIGWLSLLPVSEVRWALTLSGGDVPMAASDKATGRGSRHSSWMPPPLLVLASLG